MRILYNLPAIETKIEWNPSYTYIGKYTKHCIVKENKYWKTYFWLFPRAISKFVVHSQKIQTLNKKLVQQFV